MALAISGTMSFSPTEGHSAAFRLAHPSTPLPVPLPTDSPGLGPTLCIRVADEVADATGGLALRLDHLPSEDRLEVELNGRALPWDQAQVSGDGWSRQQAAPLFWASYPTRPVEGKMEGVSVEFALDSSLLRQGTNEIAVRLVAEQEDRREQVILTGVEVAISH